jgi:diguanylate cyclase (GGDEF)-like protein/PAS domain S-box-containing protein
LGVVDSQLRSICQGSWDMVLILESDMTARHVSGAIETVLGYRPEDVVGRSAAEFIHPADFPDVKAKFADALRIPGLAAPSEFRVRHADGSWVEMQAVANNPFEGGGARGLVVCARDLTGRNRAAELTMVKEKALELSINAVAFADMAGNVTYVNRSFLKMWRYDDPEEVLGRPVTEFWKVGEKGQLALKALHERGGWIGELVGKRKDGTFFDVQISATTVTDDAGKPICGMASFVDVTERRRLDRRVRSLLLKDKLTGLYNRRGFFALAEQQLKLADRSGKKISLFFVDMDGTKKINDTLGHRVGDEALTEAAGILTEVFRDSDIIARVGGDEFVILAPGSPDPTSARIAARLEEHLRLCNAAPHRRYRLSLSLGSASYDPEDPRTIDEIITRADRDMYTQKRGRGGRPRHGAEAPAPPPPADQGNGI